MTADDVKVLLSEGSVIADIACIVPKNISLVAVHEALTSGGAVLRAAVVQNLGGLPGISAFGTSGDAPISVEITKATFKGDLMNYTRDPDPSSTTEDPDIEPQGDGALRIHVAATWVLTLVPAMASFFQA